MSVKIEQTFLQKTKRYFEPIFLEKRITLKTIIIYSIWWITPIIHVIFIQEIIKVFESWTRDDFIFILTIYLVYNIVYEIVDFLLKRWWWVENINAYRKIIDTRYIKKYIWADNNAIEKQGTWKMVSIITNGSDKWALSLDLFILEVTKILFIFSYSLYMFSQVSLLFAGIFLWVYLIVFYIWALFNSHSLILRRKRLDFWHQYTRRYVRILMSKIEILQSWKVQEEISGIHEYANSMTQTNKDMAWAVYGCYRTAEASVIWLKMWILFYVGLWYFSWDFTLSFFVWLFAIMALMEATVNGTMKFFRNFTKEFTTIESLWNFFDTTPQIEGYDKWEIFKHSYWAISLKNLTYGYTADRQIFESLSLDLKGNQITALVWPSGGGKSTLVKLISGYIRQDMWDIIVDKQNLRDVSLKSYYKEIGYLTQEPSVFDGTVRENLLYAVTKNPDKKDLETIMKLAHCEFIYDFPDWLETEIGERGVKLSGGQKQRLAIAKIFLKNPKIIILDEPTSALDSMSEKKITQAMQNLFQWRTVIIIAHRLQTVKHADDIIVIEWWKVIERGTHSSLIGKKGFYKQMLDLQSGF